MDHLWGLPGSSFPVNVSKVQEMRIQHSGARLAYYNVSLPIQTSPPLLHPSFLIWSLSFGKLSNSQYLFIWNCALVCLALQLNFDLSSQLYLRFNIYYYVASFSLNHKFEMPALGNNWRKYKLWLDNTFSQANLGFFRQWYLRIAESVGLPPKCWNPI